MSALAAGIRTCLNTWGRLGKAPGLWYQAVERWGAADETLPCRLPDGSHMICDLRDHVQRLIYFQGCYEPIESMLFTRLLRPGMTVIDVGANVGQYTLLAARAVGAKGSVHSFEPVPQNFARLAEHVRENHLTNVYLNRLALYSQRDSVKLTNDSRETGNAGTFGIRAGGTVDAEAIALDEYLVDHPVERLDFIKMDIEGAEPFALQGMRRALERFCPTLLMEINRRACELAGTAPEMIWDELARLDYKIFAIGISADLSRALNDFRGIDLQNVILHHRELPRSVTEGWTLKQALRWARGGKT